MHRTGSSIAGAFLAARRSGGLVRWRCRRGEVARPLASAAGPQAASRAPAAPIAALQQAMRGHVFERGAARVRGRRPRLQRALRLRVLPHAVARPIDAADVQAAVRWAVGHGVPLRARSGGHSYAGYSTLLERRRARSAQDERDHGQSRRGTATIGAGAQLIDVYAGLAAKGATIPAGSCPSVGHRRRHARRRDGSRRPRVRADRRQPRRRQIVTADGRLRTGQTSSNDPDLLWALRGGGGGNFGVVTQLTFQVHALPAAPRTSSSPGRGPRPRTRSRHGSHWAPHARDQLTSIFHLNAGAGGRVGRRRPASTSDPRQRSRRPARARCGRCRGATSRPGRGLSRRCRCVWAGCEHESARRLPHGRRALRAARCRASFLRQVRLRRANRCPQPAAATP